MKCDPLKHHRRSIRLKGYDYRRPGAYFVTAVTRGRLLVYGEIVKAEMRLNAAGQMIERWWLELPNKFPTIALDAYVVMPNHFHGIIVITDERKEGADEQGQGADSGEGADSEEGAHTGAKRPQHGNDEDGADGVHADQSMATDSDGPAVGFAVGAASRLSGRPASEDAGRPASQSAAHPSLPTLMQWFKTMTTNDCIRGVNARAWPPFPGKLWQRDYYERVIRNPAELDAIRRYNANNPAQWALDEENPARSAAGRATG